MAGSIDVKVRNAQVTVRVEDSGDFTCNYGGTFYREKQMDTLRGKLLAASRKASMKVHVQFVERELRPLGWGLKYGTATGIHGSSGNMLIRWAGKSITEQERPWGNHKTRLRNLSKDEERTYLKLLREESDAAAAVRNFEEPRTIDVRAEVEKLIRAESEKQAASEPATEPEGE